MSLNSLSADLAIYLAYFLPAAFIVARQVKKRGKKYRDNAATLKEARDAGLSTPVSLHPVINTSRCIGCEACVHACPEFPAHKVLGLVRGKATLVSPTDCIGHGACKAACPVGAISLVYGSAERGVDIPMVAPDFESNIPGLYIAGELGGMGLIRNAIEQGRQAMESIGKRQDVGKGEGILDVVIVGAGPAGLSASLGAMAHKLRFVTIDQNTLGGTVANFPRGKIVMTAPAELPLVGKVKFGETTKEILMDFWEKVVREQGLNIHYQERMEGLRRENVGFTVKTNKTSYRARTVLLCIGRRGTPRQLGVAGEDLAKVTYALIDPAEFAGKRVLVVGGGDSALEAAHSIADQPGAQVILSYRSAAFSRAKMKNRQKVEAYFAEGRLEVLLESSVTEITPEAVVIETQQGTKELANDAVIICAGGILPTSLLTGLGVTVETKYGTA